MIPVEPELTLLFKNNQLVLGTDYDVTYKFNDRPYDGVTKAEIIITGKKNFTGTRTIYFMIQTRQLSLKDGAQAKFIHVLDDEFEIANSHTSMSDDYILGKLTTKTTVKQVVEMFEDDIQTNIQVFNHKGVVVLSGKYNTTYIGTGYRLDLRDSNGELVDRVYVSIKGDVNGDGLVNYNDYYDLAYNRVTMTNAAKFAADVNYNGYVDVRDKNIIQKLAQKPLELDAFEQDYLDGDIMRY